MPVFPRGVWIVFAAIAGLFGLQMLGPGLGRQDAPPPAAAAAAVDFAGSGPIELSDVGASGASATVLVRNDSGGEALAAFEGTMLDRRGQPLGTMTASAALKSPVTPVVLTLTPVKPFDLARDDRLPARGVLVMTARPSGRADASPTIRSRELTLLQIQPSAAERAITSLGLIAGAIVLLYGVAAGFSAKSNAQLAGTPAWTPQSWSTNLAIGGALLAMVLGIAALPAQTHYAARTAYATLSTFFATLVALAPAVYGLLKVGTPSPPAALRLFAFAAGVTVWATVGQLGITGLLFLELGAARVISWTSARSAALLFAIVALLVFVYALRAVNAYKTGESPVTGATVPPSGTAGRWPLL